MITGHRHDDLEVVPTVQNCMRLYQRLVTLGTWWKPEYKIQLVTEALTHQFLVLAAAFSPNGTRVVTASWDVPTRSLPRAGPYFGPYFSVAP
jgi:WD40 repeat protein